MDTLQIYLNSLDSYPKYDDTETETLLNDIEQIKRNLIDGNLKLVALIALEMHRNWPDADVMDYIQEGNETLIKIVDKFDPKRCVKFSSFLSYCVKKQILRFIKDTTAPIRLYNSRAQRAVYANLESIRQAIAQGEDLEELAYEIGVNIHDVDVIINAGDRGTLDDLEVPSPEEIYVKNEASERLLSKIRAFRQTLNEQELLIFDDVLYAGTASLKDIADFFGVSRQYMWKVKEGVLKRGRKFFTYDDLKSITS